MSGIEVPGLTLPEARTPSPSGQQFGDSVYQRLLQDRIIFMGTQVADEMANAICAQILLLAADDPEKDIFLYINSPGGSVSAGLAIYDTMKFIPCDVQTVCFGMAASMGSVLLGAGTKGKRSSLRFSKVMLHQSSGGFRGNIQDAQIDWKEWQEVNQILFDLFADDLSFDQPLKL